MFHLSGDNSRDRYRSTWTRTRSLSPSLDFLAPTSNFEPVRKLRDRDACEIGGHRGVRGAWAACAARSADRSPCLDRVVAGPRLGPRDPHHLGSRITTEQRFAPPRGWGVERLARHRVHLDRVEEDRLGPAAPAPAPAPAPRLARRLAHARSVIPRFVRVVPVSVTRTG